MSRSVPNDPINETTTPTPQPDNPVRQTTSPSVQDTSNQGISEQDAPCEEISEQQTPARAANTDRRVLGIVGKVLGWLLAILGVILFASSIWVTKTFGPVNVHQLLANLPSVNGGGGNGDPETIRSYFVEAVAIPVALLAALGCFYYVAVHRIRQRSPHGWFARHRGVISALLSLALFAGGTTSMASSIRLAAYIRGIFTEETLANYYKEPVILSEPIEKKNLVIIYLESMDDAFGQEEIMGEDLLRSLDESTQGWASIDLLQNNPYYGYTMGGVVDSMCGTPPKPADGMVITEAPDGANNQIGDGEQSFMPSAVCLGDILRGSGYSNVYMGGAPSSFANKGMFLRTHGYDTVIGRDEWVAAGETELSGWGLSDRRLFEEAKLTVKELHDAEQPFTFTTITLDNHSPVHDFGHCPDISGGLERSTLRCQSEIVADFIDYMKGEGILEDTVVVVMADHLAFTSASVAEYKMDMRSEEQEQLPLYNRIWSPDGVEFARTEGINANMYPTMLELLGYELQDGRAGVGVAFQVPATTVAGQRTILDLNFDDLANLFNSSSSDLYRELWKPREEQEVPTGQAGTLNEVPASGAVTNQAPAPKMDPTKNP